MGIGTGIVSRTQSLFVKIARALAILHRHNSITCRLFQFIQELVENLKKPQQHLEKKLTADFPIEVAVIYIYNQYIINI